MSVGHFVVVESIRSLVEGNFGVSEKPGMVGRKRSQVQIPGIGASSAPSREI